MNLIHTPRAASPHHFDCVNPSIWSRDPETRYRPKLASVHAGRFKRGLVRVPAWPALFISGSAQSILLAAHRRGDLLADRGVK